jgi:hypothetical protein
MPTQILVNNFCDALKILDSRQKGMARIIVNLRLPLPPCKDYYKYNYCHIFYLHSLLNNYINIDLILTGMPQNITSKYMRT